MWLYLGCLSSFAGHMPIGESIVHDVLHESDLRPVDDQTWFAPQQPLIKRNSWNLLLSLCLGILVLLIYLYALGWALFWKFWNIKKLVRPLKDICLLIPKKVSGLLLVKIRNSASTIKFYLIKPFCVCIELKSKSKTSCCDEN